MDSSHELPGAAPLIDALGAETAAPLLALAAATERVGDVRLPATLSAQQRHAVHVFCEGVGLQSTSAGAGDDRQVSCRDVAFDGAAWARSTLRALDAERDADASELDVALQTLTANECTARGITVLGLRAADVDVSGPGVGLRFCVFRVFLLVFYRFRGKRGFSSLGRVPRLRSP